MLGTIGSHGGGSEEHPRYHNPIGNKDQFERDSNTNKSTSTYSKNDGGRVDLEKILSGEETRTNLMVRNIPCRYIYSEIK